MITVTKENYKDYFSREDLLYIIQCVAETSTANDIELLKQEKVCIEFIQLELKDKTSIVVELLSTTNEEETDILKLIRNVFISENEEDMDEVLDNINEHLKLIDEGEDKN